MNITEWTGIFGLIIGILGAYFSFFAWRQVKRLRKEHELEKKRQNRKVMVVLHYGGDQIQLPVELRRAELTRAEILGRLGMIPMKQKGQRFSIGYLNTQKFLQQINQIAGSNDDGVLTIPCQQDEFEQFDIICNYK